MSRKSTKARNHTVGEQRNLDSAENVINFPNTLSSDIYVDSDDKEHGSYVNAIYENANNLITAQVSRVGLKFVDMDFNIPNSNIRNNEYKFIVDGSATILNFTLPVKKYLTVTELLDEIKTEMETVAAADLNPIVITFTEINNTSKYTMTSDVGFKFVSCSGIDYGTNLHGIKYTAGFITSIIIIPKLYYTRYIDILISELGDAKVMTHRFSQPKRFNVGNHLTRLYIPWHSKINDNGSTISKQLTNFQRENININYYPFRHRDITEFQISLFDEYQEILTLETHEVDTTDPITSTICAVPYVKYNLVLSIIG